MPSYKAVQVVDPPNTKLVELPALPSATPGHIVVQNTFACVSPVDVLVNSNSFPGMIKPVPFTTGLEGVGVVTEVGTEVDGFKPGDYVTYVGAPAFAEYTLVPAPTAVKTSSATAETMSVSYAACASASLEMAGEMKSGETVLVTAAAGGVGQYVVQLAKLAGNTVIGTTSSAEKAKFLLELGCDRVINYSEEDAGAVLTEEYPQGIDLLFDNVGGDFLVALVPHLAMFSRIVSFGVTSGYTAGPDTDKQKPGQLQSVLSALILKCASIRGISLGTNPAPLIKHRAITQTLLDEGKLRPGIDPTVFAGLESVPDALAYVLAKRNMGKVAVQIQKLP